MTAKKSAILWICAFFLGLLAASCTMENRTPRLGERELINPQGGNIADIAQRKARTREAYGKLPLHFEANQGQADPEVRFLSWGAGYTLFLTPTEAVLALRNGASGTGSAQRAVLRMKLVGSNPEPQVNGLDELPGKANYFIGSDPSKWRPNIPTYARVKYQNVYPGIDLVYYGNQRQLEYDFVVAPGADPRAIKLAFEGAEIVQTDSNGDLVLKTDAGEVRLKKPYIYQVVNGVKQPVPGSYVLNARSKIENPQSQEVSFQLAAYDTSKPLVIDPVLTLISSTYFGGSDNEDSVAIAVDAQGSAYVTGKIPGIADNNVFVARLDPTGSLIYSTSLGGSGDESGVAIAVDNKSNAYITGHTTSTNFPGPGGGGCLTFGSGNDFEFVAKLNADGKLLYSACLNADDDHSLAIAADSSGNAYIAGFTNFSAFPGPGGGTALKLGSAGSYNALVAKFDTSKPGDPASFLYSALLGGDQVDEAHDIAVDSSGNVYVTGFTSSNAVNEGFLITPGAFDNSYNGGGDAFVAKINPDPSLGTASLLYLTYLGGSMFDFGFAIAVDSSGKAYVAGSTASADFLAKTPIPNTACPGDFVAIFDPDPSLGPASLLYSTCGAGGAIAVAPSGKHIFLKNAKLDPVANKLVPYPPAFIAGDIAFDASCNVYTTGAAKPISGDSDAFVQKIGQGDLFAYISNFNDGTVSVIDAAKHKVVDTKTTDADPETAIEVGAAPRGVAVHPTGMRAYVTNFNDSTVSVIDTDKNTQIDTDNNPINGTTPIKLGDNLKPIGVAVHPSGKWVYVANTVVDTTKGKHVISVIDAATNQLLPPLELAPVTEANVPFGIAVHPHGTKLYVTNQNGRLTVNQKNEYFVTVITINPMNSPPSVDSVKTVTVGKLLDEPGMGPQGIAVSPDGKLVYVANFGSVSVIETTNHTKINFTNPGDSTNTDIKVGGIPFGVAVHPDGKRVYVTVTKPPAVPNPNPPPATVIPADLAVLEFTQPSPALPNLTTVQVGNLARGVTVTPDGAFVYVANSDDDSVSVINTANNQRIDFDVSTSAVDDLKVGDGPVAFGQFIGALLDHDKDKDGDGISDLVDGFIDGNGKFVPKSDPTDSTASSNKSFTNKHLCGTVSGFIDDPGGLTVTIESPAGLVVKTGPGQPGQQAKITYCDGFKTLSPGPSEVHPLTCSALTARVVVGPITFLLDDQGFATVPSGTTVRVARLAPGQFEIQNLDGTEPIIVEFDGQVTQVEPGGTGTFSPDSDGDGVPDHKDRCQGTPSGKAVDANGCSGEQLIGRACPCAGPATGGAWKNHGMYVSCVAREAERVAKSGLINQTDKGAIVSQAARSTCGGK